MRKNKSIKLIAMLLAAILFIAMLSLINVEKAYTAVGITGNPTSLVITRNVNNVTNPVENTFTYTITDPGNNPAAVTNLPLTKTLTFDGTETITSGKATKTASLDLSGLRFSELGDYKLAVTETASSNSTAYPVDNTKTYYIHVSVRDNVNGSNVPTGTLVATLAGQVTEGTGTSKVDMVFETNPQFTCISISNAVSGNMASKDKYFKFKVDIEGVNEGTSNGETYKIVGPHSTDGVTTVNSSDYVVGETEYIYLKHGQSVTIGKDGTNNQIGIGAKYHVIEQDAPEYTTTINNDTLNPTKDSLERTTVATESSNSLAFLNNYQAATFTGVAMNVLPYAVLVVLAVVGIIAIFKTSKKRN